MCRMNHLTPILSLSIFIGIASAACSGDVVEGSSAVCSESSGSSPTTTSNTTGTASSVSSNGSDSSITSGNTTSTSGTGDLSGSSEPATTAATLDIGSLDCGIINVCGSQADCDAAGLGQACGLWLLWCLDVCTQDCEFPCLSATERAFGDDLCPPCDLSNLVN